MSDKMMALNITQFEICLESFFLHILSLHIPNAAAFYVLLRNVYASMLGEGRRGVVPIGLMGIWGLMRFSAAVCIYKSGSI